MADPAEGGVVLGPFVGQFRQGFGGGDPDADGHADVPPDRGLHLPSQGEEFGGGAFDAEEGLVDAVDLKPGRVAAEQFHDPGADVTVELVVAGQGNESPFLGPGCEFEPGLAHGDAEGFGFGGAGDGAAIVIGQNDHGPAFQRRVECPFRGGIEAVHVHMRDLRQVPHQRRLRHAAPLTGCKVPVGRTIARQTWCRHRVATPQMTRSERAGTRMSG